MSEGKGKLTGRVKRVSLQQDSNSGASREAGYPFKHVVLGGSKHSARYVSVDGQLTCSICGAHV
jgi:hypothetical protein